MKCLLCESSKIEYITQYSELPRVTSDCKPYIKGGKLSICCNCSLIQKVPDELWLSEIKDIYDNYTIYHQSAGVEQSVYDQTTGEPKLRSLAIAEQIQKNVDLPTKGELLDIGCGNGAFINGFSRVFSDWSLDGLEQDEKNLVYLNKIKNFSKLITEDINDYAKEYDFVSLMHSLEHFTDPISYLKDIRKNIKKDGYLFIQVPNIAKNKFDYLVADHLSHFDKTTLSNVLETSGYEVILLSDDWITKELSILARKLNSIPENDVVKNHLVNVGKVNSDIKWLGNVLIHAKEYSDFENFGVFGSSIAATWLYGELNDKIKYFVDEDPSRNSQLHMGKVILSPDKIPDNSIVYIPLIKEIADKVKDRLSKYDFKIIVPEQ